jgi:hypothetical protein
MTLQLKSRAPEWVATGALWLAFVTLCAAGGVFGALLVYLVRGMLV